MSAAMPAHLSLIIATCLGIKVQRSKEVMQLMILLNKYSKPKLPHIDLSNYRISLSNFCEALPCECLMLQSQSVVVGKAGMGLDNNHIKPRSKVRVAGVL